MSRKTLRLINVLLPAFLTLSPLQAQTSASGSDQKEMPRSDPFGAYCRTLSNLTESNLIDCGETSADGRSRASDEPNRCAMLASRAKKAFTLTRRLALGGGANGGSETLVGQSSGQLIRILFRPDVCGFSQKEQIGCGPRFEVTSCKPGVSRISGRLVCEPIAEGRSLPEGARPNQISDDPQFGTTRENPIKIGTTVEGRGPSTSRWYIGHLWDRDFKPFSYERLGSLAGPDKHMLDHYLLIDSRGNEYEIFIDMYHPENDATEAKAPKGMYIWK